MTSQIKEIETLKERMKEAELEKIQIYQKLH